jgi:LysM repeat protein
MDAAYRSRLKLFLLILAAGASTGCEEWGEWKARSAPPITREVPEQPSTPPSPTQETYAVQYGDGWWYIARAQGVSMGALLAVNGATPATPLHPGQVIQLPAGAAPSDTPAPNLTSPVQWVAPQPGPFIPYPGNGLGPTPCADGSWSHSSGRGTCSHHGGASW